MSRILLALENIAFNFGFDNLFFVASGIMLAIFFSFLIFSIFSVKAVKRVRRKYFYMQSTCFLAHITISLFLLKDYAFYTCIALPLVNFIVSLILYIPISFIREKTYKIEKSQLDFVKKMDIALKSQKNDSEVPFIPVSVIKGGVKDYREDNREEDFDINYSHVKNIIERLNLAPLNSTDRKQVNDLDSQVSMAMRYGLDQDKKEKLNDGLNALLKIMSKYCV